MALIELICQFTNYTDEFVWRGSWAALLCCTAAAAAAAAALVCCGASLPLAHSPARVRINSPLPTHVRPLLSVALRAGAIETHPIGCSSGLCVRTCASERAIRNRVARGTDSTSSIGTPSEKEDRIDSSVTSSLSSSLSLSRKSRRGESRRGRERRIHLSPDTYMRKFIFAESCTPDICECASEFFFRA